MEAHLRDRDRLPSLATPTREAEQALTPHAQDGTPTPNLARTLSASSLSSAPRTPVAQILNSPSAGRYWTRVLKNHSATSVNTNNNWPDDDGTSSTCSSSCTGASGSDGFKDWPAGDDELLLQTYAALMTSPLEAPFAGEIPPSGLVSRVARQTSAVARQKGRTFPHSPHSTRRRLLLLCARQASLARPFRDSGYGESGDEDGQAPSTPSPRQQRTPANQPIKRPIIEDFSFVKDDELQHAGFDAVDQKHNVISSSVCSFPTATTMDQTNFNHQNHYESSYPTPASPLLPGAPMLDDLRDASHSSGFVATGIVLSTPIQAMSMFTQQSRRESSTGAASHEGSNTRAVNFSRARTPNLGGLRSPFSEILPRFRVSSRSQSPTTTNPPNSALPPAAPLKSATSFMPASFPDFGPTITSTTTTTIPKTPPPLTAPAPTLPSTGSLASAFQPYTPSPRLLPSTPALKRDLSDIAASPQPPPLFSLQDENELQVFAPHGGGSGGRSSTSEGMPRQQRHSVWSRRRIE